MPFESRGKIHLSILTTSLYPPSRVVGQRNQLNNTELSRQDSKLRERGSERDRKQKVPGRVERPVPMSDLDSSQ